MNSTGKMRHELPASQATRNMLVEMFRDISLDLRLTEALPRVPPVGTGDFTPLQESRLYHNFAQQTNPATGKKWTLVEIARHFNVPYYRVRNLHALMMPYKASQKGKPRQRSGGTMVSGNREA